MHRMATTNEWCTRTMNSSVEAMKIQMWVKSTVKQKGIQNRVAVAGLQPSVKPMVATIRHHIVAKRYRTECGTMR